MLDCFTHTGSFALNAARGGAARVTAVDVSEFAVECARENAARNGLSQVVDCVAANVFDLLPQLQKGQYDFIILDPPAFTKSRQTTQRAMAGYKEINYRAMRLLPRGGYLATCSCSHFATEELFRKCSTPPPGTPGSSCGRSRPGSSPPTTPSSGAWRRPAI